jgi:hypothetical protein
MLEFVRKGERCEGMDSGVETCNKFKAGKPCEGLLAKFAAEGTYEGEIHRQCVLNKYRMHCSTRFCSGLRDFPPWMA